MENLGSTCSIERIRPGVVIKKPHVFESEELAKKVERCFSVEPSILQKLGQHPRIVGYLGHSADGILLREASHGDLELYLRQNNAAITVSQRMIWCHQATEAIVYIHNHGVVHSDIRPRNFLLHEAGGHLDILLCDFGGATCPELDLDGGCLPDGPFYNPAFGITSVPGLDIFALGSLLYTISTGHWPYRTSSEPLTMTERASYEAKVQLMIKQQEFPDVRPLIYGNVIMSCWKMEYRSAEEVLEALDEIGGPTGKPWKRWAITMRKILSGLCA